MWLVEGDDADHDHRQDPEADEGEVDAPHLTDVRPSLAPNDLADVGLGNPESLGKVYLSHSLGSQPPNFADLLGVEARGGVALAAGALLRFRLREGTTVIRVILATALSSLRDHVR